MTRALHWFRDDLRLRDNGALREAARHDEVGFVYVLDPALIASPRVGAPRLSFLLEALGSLGADLEKRGLRLHVARGAPVDVVPSLASKLGVDRVTWSEDTTPYARRRDARVAEQLDAAGIGWESTLDRTLTRSGDLRNGSGQPYTTFTPYRNSFWKHWTESRPLPAPRFRGPLDGLEASPPPDLADLGRALPDPEMKLPPASEAAALRRLRAFVTGALRDYASDRDRMDLDGTARISAYLRFGLLTPLQCVAAAREAARGDAALREGAAKWCDEILWRDFYAGILEAHPHVLQKNFRRDLGKLRWRRDPGGLEAWSEGRTGYPIVDAAMRQLRATGWMHNRARMIVASFLTKDLGLDWRLGERHFEQWLVDADPASNNGGWQWSASTGTDAQPWFRIFNPLSQARRFDPEGDYVRRWVPELRSIGGAAVHDPGPLERRAAGYPDPIVDHAVRRVEALRRFETARTSP